MLWTKILNTVLFDSILQSEKRICKWTHNNNISSSDQRTSCKIKFFNEIQLCYVTILISQCNWLLTSNIYRNNGTRPPTCRAEWYLTLDKYRYISILDLYRCRNDIYRYLSICNKVGFWYILKSNFDRSRYISVHIKIRLDIGYVGTQREINISSQKNQIVWNECIRPKRQTFDIRLMILIWQNQDIWLKNCDFFNNFYLDQINEF